MKKMNPSNSVTPSVPPSFRGELYFLMAKFLENGPCTETAARLKKELTEKSLLQPRYDWKGIAHAKTFRDMEEEFDPSGNSIPKEHLLQLCFDLCNVNPAVPTVRSLLSHSRLENKRRKANVPTVANLMKQLQNKDLGIGHYPNSNIWTSKGSWHEKHLCRHLKRLRKTLGHLSSVYCLTFDRTGRLAFTGADDMLVKCWNVSDGRLLYTFRGGAAEVSDMTVSHDNRMLAVATLDKIARVWDLHTGEPLAVLTRHTGTLTGINFSSYVGSDGQRYLACTSSDGTAAFWRYKYATITSTGSKLKSTVKTDTTSKSFKVEFDEQPTRWCERSRPGKAKIISSCFSPGGLFFCTGSADHYVRIYQMDCPDGPQRILEEGEHEDQVDSIQWCNTSQLRLLSGSSDGTARIWTYKAGKWNTIVLNMNQSETSSCTPARKERPKNQETAQSYPQQPPISLATANRPPGRLGNERRGVQQAEVEQRRPARRAAAQAAAMVNAAHAANDQQANANLQSPLGSRDIPSISGNDHTNSINNGSSSSQDEKKAVTMVQWSTDDRYAITAVADFTLKVWNSQNGTLVTILKGHSSLVYTVEPHPLTENIFLSAGHDGYLKVWDISTSTCLFSARNIIDMQGHAAVYDAKWSPGDGNIICATDSHGHLVFFGPGSSERYEKYPTELFFHTDYRPLLRDSYHNVVDEQTQTLPHLMPPPLLIDSEGSPYPPQVQRLVRGRETSTNADALQPMLAPVRNNADEFDADQIDQQAQPRRLQLPPPPAMQPDPNAANVNANIVQIPRSMMNVARRQQHIINEDNIVSQDSNGSSGTGQEDSGPEHRLDRHADDQPGPSNNVPPNEMAQQPEPASSIRVQNSDGTSTTTTDQSRKVIPYKLCILKYNVCSRVIEESLNDFDSRTRLECVEYYRESGLTGRKRSEHDYARPKGKSKNQYLYDRSASSGRNASAITNSADRVRREDRDRSNRDHVRPVSNGQPRRRYLMREDDEEDENANAEDNDDDELDTSDCSLDESDFSSSESTTEVSSEHSDWGSGDENEPDASQPQQLPTKKRSPKNKRKRNAAEKCRERMLKPGDQITGEFIPSPWLAESIPRKSPFFPQIGDVLMYFKQGHERYVDLVKERKAYKINMKEQYWMKRKNLKEDCMVRITGIKWEIRPPRLCVLKLSILNESNGKATGEHFTIKYHDMNDVVDFLVLRQTFNSYKGKHWKNGDRIRCQIDDCWWKGTVKKIVHHDAAKKSPFLSIFVNWDNGEKEYLSPWDLEALNVDTSEIGDGTYATQEELKSCLYKPSSEEWNCMGRESECTRISEALESIMSLAIAEPFNYPVDLTNYPEYMLDVEYPMDLTLIKARVDNQFYRRIAAIQRDIKYIYENAASFNRPKSIIVKNAAIITKLADEIIGNTTKSKTDVSNIYHRLSENFQWPASSSSDEDNNETKRPSSRSSRLSRSSKSSPKSPNLNPKKWKHDCNELLNEMVALPFSQAFREPVSEIEFPDYHRYIATPMDLSTVRESLHIGDYNSPLEFEKDVHLIFKNSKDYNTVAGSKVLKMTIKMEEWFAAKFPELVSDWRRTNRRLSVAKQKHKAKMRHSSGASSTGASESRSKGKGKGKGKGQSNRINASRSQRSRRNDSDDDDEESEQTESEEDEDSDEATPDKPRRTRIPRSKRNQRKHMEEESSGDDDNSDKLRRTRRNSSSTFTSRRASTSATAMKKLSTQQEAIENKPNLECPLDLQVEEEPHNSEEVSPAMSNGSMQRRVSTRVPKQPIRFRDESSELDSPPAKRTSDRTTRCTTSFNEEIQSDDDVKANSSTSQPIPSATTTVGTTSPSKSVTESLRSVRIRKHRKRNESGTYSEDNLAEENEDGKLLDTRKGPGSLTGVKRKSAAKDSDSEDEPLVKRTATQNTSSRKSKSSQSGDEEDVPLARKKSNQRPSNGHIDSTSETIIAEKTISEQPTSSRPIRSAARAAIKTFAEAHSESEDERPLRRTISHTTNSPKKNVAFAPQIKSSAPQFDHDSSEDQSADDYNKTKKRNTRSRQNSRVKNREGGGGRKRRSEESESEFSESESEEDATSDGENEEESDSQTSDEEFVCKSVPSKTLGSRANSRNTRPQRRAEATKIAREAVDSAESDDEKYDARPKRKINASRHQSSPRKKLANRNVSREDNQSSDDLSEAIKFAGRLRDMDKNAGKRQKRARAARRNYNESESDNSSSGRENRRPSKRSNRRTSPRKQANENYSGSDSDQEDEPIRNSKQATITSRGRVSKPNPRII